MTRVLTPSVCISNGRVSVTSCCWRRGRVACRWGGAHVVKRVWGARGCVWDMWCRWCGAGGGGWPCRRQVGKRVVLPALLRVGQRCILSCLSLHPQAVAFNVLRASDPHHSVHLLRVHDPDLDRANPPAAWSPVPRLLRWMWRCRTPHSGSNSGSPLGSSRSARGGPWVNSHHFREWLQ